MRRKLTLGVAACALVFGAVFGVGLAVARPVVPACGLDCIDMNLRACLACCIQSCTGNAVLDCQDGCK